jgi:hypothetical protein
MILSYMRNKYASTIDLEDGSVLVRASVEDTFFAAAVEMEVKLPDLEIASVKGEIKRAFNDECQQAAPLLQKAVGLRIGTGIIKAINGLIGGPAGCPRLADLTLECCDEVILRFTIDPVRKFLSKSGQVQLEARKELVKQNPRLVGSCIAFAKGSPLMQGIEI